MIRERSFKHLKWKSGLACGILATAHYLSVRGGGGVSGGSKVGGGVI